MLFYRYMPTMPNKDKSAQKGKDSGKGRPSPADCTGPRQDYSNANRSDQRQDNRGSTCQVFFFPSR